MKLLKICSHCEGKCLDVLKSSNASHGFWAFLEYECLISVILLETKQQQVSAAQLLILSNAKLNVHLKKQIDDF